MEYALGLRADALIHSGWTKAILREAMRGLLPESVRLRRDKLGFPTPEKRWLSELAPQVREWLGPGSRIACLLRKHALEGFQGKAGVMPMKGGQIAMADQSILNAVDYMVTAAR